MICSCSKCMAEMYPSPDIRIKELQAKLAASQKRERILREGIIRIRAMATPSCYFAVAESYQVVDATNEILKAAEEVKG